MDNDYALLNVFEVEHEGRTRHVIGLIDPVLAGVRGLDSRAILGEYSVNEAGEFDPEAFQVNPDFVAAVTDYINTLPDHDDELRRQAARGPSQWLYLLDPRWSGEPSAEPPAAEILGAFAVDDAGQIVPRSFQYNAHHRWFAPRTGASGMLSDRRFYAWLHPMSPDGAVRQIDPPLPPTEEASTGRLQETTPETPDSRPDAGTNA